MSFWIGGFNNIRISNGNRLEVQYSTDDHLSFWGTICSGGFDDDAADVACRQLGYVQSSDVYSYS